MKKNLMILCFVSAMAILFGACGGSSATTTAPGGNSGTAQKTETAKIDDSKWTAKDKENAVNNCKFGRKNDDPAKVEVLCKCFLNKVIALSPNPADQSKIPMSETMKVNDDCRKEAGL